MEGVDSTQTPEQVKRMAIVYSVIDALGDSGKTQLQKTIYFLQQAFGVQTKYQFRMHHYGPYSEDLDKDMTLLSMLGYVSIKIDTQGYGYHVAVSDQPERDWESLVSPFKDSIAQVLSLVQGKVTSELELMATLHFVDSLNANPPVDKLIDTVKGLKPKFSSEHVKNVYRDLVDAGLLGIDRS